MHTNFLDPDTQVKFYLTASIQFLKTNLSINSAKQIVCPDLEEIQKSTPGFPAEIIPRRAKMKSININNGGLWRALEIINN